MNSMVYLISFNVLAEPKLEPKLTKSVAFLLRKNKTENIKSVAEIYFD